MSDADGLWTKLNDIFHFTVDAAASADNAKLPKFWDKQTDALKQDWSKETVWLNPPFSRIEEFLGKAKTATLTVAIVPATALTTRYFASVKSDWMAIPPTRVHFDPPTGVRKKVQHATHGYPFLIYGQPRKEQIAALEQMGMVCYRC